MDTKVRQVREVRTAEVIYHARYESQEVSVRGVVEGSVGSKAERRSKLHFTFLRENKRRKP